MSTENAKERMFMLKPGPGIGILRDMPEDLLARLREVSNDILDRCEGRDLACLIAQDNPQLCAPTTMTGRISCDQENPSADVVRKEIEARAAYLRADLKSALSKINQALYLVESTGGPLSQRDQYELMLAAVKALYGIKALLEKHL